jgi:AraC family transcriptional regulator
MADWDKMNPSQIPTLELMGDYIRNPVWKMVTDYVIDTYETKPTFEFSRCAWPGWNVKFKKAGKNLCTMYPFEGFLWVLVVIGKHEKDRFDEELPQMSEYLQNLAMDTPEGMGQKWLQIELEDEDRLEDVKRCIAIKRGKISKK